MTAFRLLLVVMLTVIIGYTLVTGANHGWNLVPIFFGDIATMDWHGQFDLDFMCFLALSGLWTAWRNDFSPAGLLLGVVAFFMGTVFLTIYLLVLLSASRGDMAAVMLGARRAATR